MQERLKSIKSTKPLAPMSASRLDGPNRVSNSKPVSNGHTRSSKEMPVNPVNSITKSSKKSSEI